MKTNELISLLQRIEHHNGGPLLVVMGSNLYNRMQSFDVVGSDADTARLIQPGSGPRPRLAKLITTNLKSYTTHESQ